MVSVLVLLSTALFCWGLYVIACEVSHCPEGKVIRALSGAAQGTVNRRKVAWEDTLRKVSQKIAPLIPMDEAHEEKMKADLTNAGLDYSPREYVARSVAAGLLVAVLGLFLGLINPMLPVLAVIAGIAVGMYLYFSVFDLLHRRRTVIEKELPRFGLTVHQHLKNDRDVLKILISYRKVAGPEFGLELDRTIAAMKSGNYEDALLRLGSRVDSPYMSEVVRGLIGTLRGDDQSYYFETLAQNMRRVERNNLQKEAAKQPAKIRKYSMLMLLCIILIYGVVLITQMISSLGAIF